MLTGMHTLLRSGLITAIGLGFASLPHVANAKSNATTKIVSTGKAPRAPLRYKMRPGKTTMLTRINMGMRMMGSKTHSVPMDMETAVVFGKHVTGKGRSYRIGLVDISVSGKPVPAAAKTMMSKLAVNGTVSDRGVVTSNKLTAVTVAPKLQQALEQYRRCMDHAFVVFPSQSLGIGAVWEVTTKQSMGGLGGKNAMAVTRVARYRLVHRHKNQVRLHVTVRVFAPPQTFMMQGSKMRIDKLNGSGSGTLRLNVRRFKPSVKMSTKTSLAIDSGGMKMDLTVLQDIKVSSK